jgi:L-fuconolactonase
MRIDAHQHFWRYRARDYGWIGPGMDVLRRDYLPPDLRPLQQAVSIEGTVAVQARQIVEETRWLLELADQYAFVKGVVGWVDLRSPRLEEQLERFSAHPRLRGVRHVVHDEPDDEFMLREDFVRGIGMLAAFGLTYDLLLFPRHLGLACDLVARFPEQPFVLDHIAKPPIKLGVLEPWAEDLRRLAAYSNVCCKVSGMVTEADWQSWKPADLRPYLDEVFEAFGADRIMVGSDWPVCTVAATYAQAIQAVADYVSQLSEAEQAWVMGETAARFYGLE